MRNFFRKYHKWFSLVATLFILFFAISGIILNHRNLLSGIDIDRNFLPSAYRYNNWNLAAIKGSEQISDDSILVYGNLGVWLTNSSYQQFRAFNTGFPKGVDNRKINTVHFNKRSGLYAGTLFGMFRYDFKKGRWDRIELPSGDERIVKIITIGDTLMVMSRSLLMMTIPGNNPEQAENHHASDRSSDNGIARRKTVINSTNVQIPKFSIISIPPPEGWDGKVGLFRTFWVVHSGEIYGFAGKILVDFVGLSIILLCITGLIYFLIPHRIRRLKDELHRSRLKRFNRGTLRWHNIVGSWLFPVLILTTFTGMFLRPPLLIPIAGSRVQPIPFSELDSPNPWFDKLRDFEFDRESGRFIVATQEGIFEADLQFKKKLKLLPYQPPVSVMGINVLKKIPGSGYLIGSFSGIFIWNTETGAITDYITKLSYYRTGVEGPPFGQVSVAGFCRVNDSTEVIFDYAVGIMAVKGKNPFPAMPEAIISQSPISLWNLALEIHTGRIFQPVLGGFYILIVPLIGLMTLIILVSGFFSWWLARKKHPRSQT